MVRYAEWRSCCCTGKGSHRRCQAHSPATVSCAAAHPSIAPGNGLVLLAVPLQVSLYSSRELLNPSHSLAGQKGSKTWHSLLGSTSWGPVVEAAGARPARHFSSAASMWASEMLARCRTPLLSQALSAAGLDPKPHADPTLLMHEADRRDAPACRPDPCVAQHTYLAYQAAGQGTTQQAECGAAMLGKLTSMQASWFQPLSVPGTNMVLGARKPLTHPCGAPARLCVRPRLQQ